ncbi:MAG: hypothetical protein KH445_06400 [Clostridium sp.]|nr:hypothetical protein [Clostridium sp.]
MRKSKKTIIYMLVALFVAVSTVLVDFNTSYALSSYNDVLNADWKLMQGGNTKEPGGNISDNFSTDFPILDQSLSKAKYTESCAWLDCNLKSGTSYVLESDSEIVLVCQYSSDGTPAMYGKEGSMYFCALSQSRIYRMSVGYKYDASVSGELQSTSFVETSNSNNYKVGFTDGKISGTDLVFNTLFATRTDGENKQLEFAVYTGKMKVFSSVSDAEQYFKTGDTSKIAWQGREPKQTYNKEVHFDSFNMDVHASNSLDNYYIDFRYSLPNNLVGKGYSLRIDSTYRREVSNVLTGDPYSSKEYTDYQYVTLSDNPFSCRVYLKNFNSVILGLADKNKSTEPFYNYYGVLSYYDSVYLGLTSMADVAKVGYKVSMSLLNISCKLEKSGSRGFSYNGSLDILTGANDIGSYTPDSNGTYKPNNDYRQNGYYYTEVSTDAAENTTYNYYYITNDNSRTEITKDENDNNSKSGEGVGNNSSSSTSGNITNNNSPVFTNNNNITVEGDSINNEVNNIVDSSSSAEDNKNFIEKFLGFFQLLENNSFLGVWGKVFGWLPPGISSVITTALGISAGIGIFRFFRR